MLAVVPFALETAGRTVVLCYLIACWLVLVEVVLPIERALPLYIAIKGNSCAQRWQQRPSLKVRLASRERDIEQCYVCIWRIIARGGRARKELLCGVELGVYLNANCQLPFLELRIASLSSLGRLGNTFEAFLLSFVFELLPEGNDFWSYLVLKRASRGIGYEWQRLTFLRVLAETCSANERRPRS